MELSKRLQAIADMVTPGLTVADVGCDHGFVSIYLYEKRIAKRVIAMDLRPGPLDRAREHIEMSGYFSYIETRLSDGITALKPGECDAVVCAGMGGRLMAKILQDGYEKIVSMKELVLQPQSELQFFRRFLRERQLHIIEENMIKEDGKYYPMMKVIPKEEYENRQAASKNHIEACFRQGKSTAYGIHMGLGQPEIWVTEADLQRIADGYGPCLLADRHPVLKEFLEALLERNKEILKKIQKSDAESKENRNAARIQTLERETKDIVYCLSLYERV